MTKRTVIVSDTKEVSVAWTRVLTVPGGGDDGSAFIRAPLLVAELEATAIREGARSDGFGSNCEVTKETAILVGERWLVPWRIVPPTEEDVKRQAAIDRRRAAIDKALKAGLDQDDIEAITGG